MCLCSNEDDSNDQNLYFSHPSFYSSSKSVVIANGKWKTQFDTEQVALRWYYKGLSQSENEFFASISKLLLRIRMSYLTYSIFSLKIKMIP